MFSGIFNKEERYRVWFGNVKDSKDGMGYAYFDTKEEAYDYAKEYNLIVLTMRAV